MKIGEIIRERQPREYENLSKSKKYNNKKNKQKRDKYDLAFSDYINMMKHDSYYRGKGGVIRQK